MKFPITRKPSRMGLLAAVATGALVLTACNGGVPAGSNASGAANSTGGTLSIGSVTEPVSFDSAQSHLGHLMQYFQPVYDSLAIRTPDGEFEPMLATDWGYDESMTELTVNLRTDVTFTDGAPFNAEAVKANIDHFKEDNGPQAATASTIEEVQVVDDDTAVIILSDPDPAMVSYLSSSLGFMGSPKALGTDEMDRVPVGSGPYVLDSDRTVTGSQYTYVKNEDYWNPDLQKFDEIVLKPMLDENARLNAIMSGQLDATILSAGTAPQAEASGLTLLTNPVDWAGLFLFDRAGEQVPALADVRVRQAINYAINKEALLEAVLKGTGEVTSQIAGVNGVMYDEELDDYYTYDPERAKELLAEAGFADGFSMTLPAAAGTDLTTHTSVQQQLGEVGITVDLATVPAPDLRNDLVNGKYPIGMWQIFQVAPWQTINYIVGPWAPFNPLKYEDETSAALVERIQDGDDEAAKELNRYVTEQAWFAPFYRVNQQYLHSDEITVENQVEQAVPSIYNYAPAS